MTQEKEEKFLYEYDGFFRIGIYIDGKLVRIEQRSKWQEKTAK